MKIKLRRGKLVEFIMTKKLEEAIDFFGSTCEYAVKTPGEPHLWEVNKNAEILYTEKAIIFTT